MKITKVETIVFNLPMLIEGSVVPKPGGTPRTSVNTLLVRVDTDEGVTGWGEGFGSRIYGATKSVIDSILGPLCVGRDPTAINELTDHLQHSLGSAGRNGPAMYFYGWMATTLAGAVAGGVLVLVGVVLTNRAPIGAPKLGEQTP